MFLFTSAVAESTAAFKAGETPPPNDMLVSDNNIVKKFARVDHQYSHYPCTYNHTSVDSH